MSIARGYVSPRMVLHSISDWMWACCEVLLARAAREFNISHMFETSVTFSSFKSRWVMLRLSYEHILEVFEKHHLECELYRLVVFWPRWFKMTGINCSQK